MSGFDDMCNLLSKAPSRSWSHPLTSDIIVFSGTSLGRFTCGMSNLNQASLMHVVAVHCTVYHVWLLSLHMTEMLGMAQQHIPRNLTSRLSAALEDGICI